MYLAQDALDSNRAAIQGALKHQGAAAPISQNFWPDLHAPHPIHPGRQALHRPLSSQGDARCPSRTYGLFIINKFWL